MPQQIFRASPSKYTEDPDRYLNNGLHPIDIGDTLEGRYQILHKLGFGSFATVWLARDLVDENTFRSKSSPLKLLSTRKNSTSYKKSPNPRSLTLDGTLSFSSLITSTSLVQMANTNVS